MPIQMNSGSSSMRYFRRFWVLALLDGVERAGRSPIAIREFNALVYLANALAPCYEIEPLDAKILKEQSGPLYPELLWDVDRLVGMGLVRVSDLVVRASGQLRSVSYSISQAGIALSEVFRTVDHELAGITKALWSVALAYARQPDAGKVLNLLARDGNYANTSYGIGDVIDFGEWDHENATESAVSHVLDIAPSWLPRLPSRGVNLYAAYLSQVARTESAE